MAAPQLLQHQGQAMAALAQSQVEHQGHYRPLEVVAHLAAAAVGIGQIELHPGLFAAGLEALHPPPGGQQIATQIGPQILQQLGLATEAGGEGQQLVQVAGDPLGEPEAGDHHRLVVVVGGQLQGPQPAHVPLVQIFVGHQLQ